LHDAWRVKTRELVYNALVQAGNDKPNEATIKQVTNLLLKEGQ